MQSHTGSLERVSKFETTVLKLVITKGRDPEHGGSQTSRLYCILMEASYGFFQFLQHVDVAYDFGVSWWSVLGKWHYGL